ncbi:hypothetical protein B0J14DRAFT_676621 [Halenospora varia]|nr:hypothetical protein B0J14DRAFT_676621 [Halenospora varia]
MVSTRILKTVGSVIALFLGANATTDAYVKNAHGEHPPPLHKCMDLNTRFYEEPQCEIIREAISNGGTGRWDFNHGNSMAVYSCPKDQDMSELVPICAKWLDGDAWHTGPAKEVKFSKFWEDKLSAVGGPRYTCEPGWTFQCCADSTGNACAHVPYLSERAIPTRRTQPKDEVEDFVHDYQVLKMSQELPHQVKSVWDAWTWVKYMWNEMRAAKARMEEPCGSYCGGKPEL